MPPAFPPSNIPDRAARAFYYMWRYSDNLRALYETPARPENQPRQIDRDKVDEACCRRRARAGRTILTEFESKQLLAAYGIPTVETHIARSEIEAVKTGGAPRASRWCSNCIRKPSRTRPTWAACN